jgi:enamine deaminase RidA (YjgF/YER057c/UK114 family)
MGLVHYAGIAPLRGTLSTLECVGEGSLGGQLDCVLDILDQCLAADGLDRSRVLSWTLYVTDVSAFMDALPRVRAWVGEHAPAATLVKVSGLAHPEQKIEITAVAAARNSRKTHAALKSGR